MVTLEQFLDWLCNYSDGTYFQTMHSKLSPEWNLSNFRRFI